MDENTIIKGKRKTNRVEFVRALHANISNLPKDSDINRWCDVMEYSYLLIGMRVYCHKSNQISLSDYAKTRNEFEEYKLADYHCDIQHDISKLNRDTDDPSLANTDPMFPRGSHSIFHNDILNPNIKCIEVEKLNEITCYCENIKINKSGFYIAADSHICKSSPEYKIEEWLIKYNIRHVKEGDIDKATGKRLTLYPYDAQLNPSKRSIEADWELYANQQEGRVLVEYFEGRGDDRYNEKTNHKKLLAKEHGIILIDFIRKDLTEIAFTKKLSAYLPRP